MDLVQLLETKKERILSESVERMNLSRLKHYQSAGTETTEQRLEKLLDLTIHCINSRQLTPMLTYSDLVARERFKASYDLFEVQTAYNCLEEAIWKRIIQNIPEKEMAEALGLISTILGAGKERLALTFVSLAGEKPVTSLDLKDHFQK